MVVGEPVGKAFAAAGALRKRRLVRWQDLDTKGAVRAVAAVILGRVNANEALATVAATSLASSRYSSAHFS